MRVFNKERTTLSLDLLAAKKLIKLAKKAKKSRSQFISEVILGLDNPKASNLFY